VKRALYAILLALCVGPPALAQSATTVAVRESRVFPVFGATAAWAIEASIVDVTVQQGKVMLLGRSPGQTKIVVSTATSQQTYDVIVVARPGTLATTNAQGQRTDGGTAEVRYSSAARELGVGASVTRADKDKRTEVTVRAITHAETPLGDRAKTSIATASYRVFTRRGREITLFDRDVDHSPLTLDATPLRGIHYLDDHWRLHAGYTAYATYRSFLVPIERQLVAGGGYAFRASNHSTFTPSFFAIRGEGTIASMLYDYRDDALSAQAELGYSHGFGGAAEVQYDGADDAVRASLRYRPDNFAVAGTTPRGFFGDASWSHRYGRGSTASASWSATDIASTRVMTGALDVDHRLSERTSLLGGATWASFNDTRAISIPVGIRQDFAHGGIGAIYRYTRSETNRGGNGLRLFGRVSAGRFYASAYADRQQSVPTLDVIFSERPDLALALAELGITANSPADIARALRENAILQELGFIDGVTIELAPSRTQFGFEAAWLGAGESRQQLRLRLLHNVIENVASRRATTLATLSYSRRLTDAMDVFASSSYWRTDAGTQPFVEAGLRQRFDGLPSILGGNGTISGVVYLDEDLDGQSDGKGVAAEVELDGVKKQRTDANGAFAFKNIPRGAHRVVARVPDKPDAYFTTASRVEAQTGDKLAFGVATTPARLFGVVKNDGGSGIGAVRVLLVRGTQQVVGETESNGAFSITATPGEWQLSILTDSVPAGYALTNLETRSVMLDRANPVHVEYVLHAHRTISGQAPANSEIIVNDRRVRADAEGHYTVRSLAPGPVTVISGNAKKTIDVPAGPAALVVDFDVAAVAPPVETVHVETYGEKRAQMTGFVVQLGAYHVRGNADETLQRARDAGVSASVEQHGTLLFVRSGPFASRDAAAIVASQLNRAGIEAVVMPRE
jgi:hypothetical protein